MNIYDAIKKDLFRLLGLVFLLILVLDFFKVGWDSTDGESRSGLDLHTDNLTGCQYLSSPRGGLVPRVDKEGTHICNWQEL
jgi:hypothetical protein